MNIEQLKYVSSAYVVLNLILINWNVPISTSN